MVTEFNSIQKYYQKKNEPEIIPRGLRSIYSRNNQLYTSNIIIIYILGLLKSSRNLLFWPKTLTKSSTNNSFYQRERKSAEQILLGAPH